MKIFDKLSKYYKIGVVERQRKISKIFSKATNYALSTAFGIALPLYFITPLLFNSASEKNVFSKLGNIGTNSADSIALNILKENPYLIHKLDNEKDLAYVLKIKGDTSKPIIKEKELDNQEILKSYKYAFDKKPGISYSSRFEIGDDSKFLSDNLLFSKNQEEIYELDDKDKSLILSEVLVKDVLKLKNSLYFLKRNFLVMESNNLEKKIVVEDIRKGVLKKVRGTDLGVLLSKNYQIPLGDSVGDSKEDYQKIDFALNNMGKDKKKHLFNSYPNLLLKDKILFISDNGNIYAFSKDSLLNNKNKIYMEFSDNNANRIYDHQTKVLENGDLELISLRDRYFGGRKRKVCVFYNEEEQFNILVGNYNKLSEIPNLNKIIDMKK